MANITTIPLTVEMYEEMIRAMDTGGCGFRPNEQIKFACVLEANLGIRISDVRRLRLCDIIFDGRRYRLNIYEKKTKKYRPWTVPGAIYDYIRDYCHKHQIKDNEIIISLSERTIDQYLAKVSDYLGYHNVSTHSFRKFYAMRHYEASGGDLMLVRNLLNHSSIATTQRYLNVLDEDMENAIAGHIYLPS